MAFDFELGQRVAIVESGETGMVIARAEYQSTDDQYLVRYKAANGCATEAWWTDIALEPSNEMTEPASDI